MKKYFKYLDWLFWILIIVFIAFRIPMWFKSASIEGTEAKDFSVLSMTGEEKAFPFVTDSPQIFIFWATWCGPCKIELSRHNEAIKKGELPQDKVFAISIGEDVELVKKTAEERGYVFSNFVDSRGQSANFYNVQATPTIVHLDKEQKVSWIGMGVSPTSVMRAKNLFKE